MINTYEQAFGNSGKGKKTLLTGRKQDQRTRLGLRFHFLLCYPLLFERNKKQCDKKLLAA